MTWFTYYLSQIIIYYYLLIINQSMIKYLPYHNKPSIIIESKNILQSLLVLTLIFKNIIISCKKSVEEKNAVYLSHLMKWEIYNAGIHAAFLSGPMLFGLQCIVFLYLASLFKTIIFFCLISDVCTFSSAVWLCLIL